jgi:hypothetical protein
MDVTFREETTGSEAALRPGDRRFLWLCVLLSAITLSIGLWLYPKVNPEASIHFQVDRRGSETVARAFLRDLGCDLAGDRHATRFLYDDDAKVFLERTLGLGRANELMGGPVRMWRWGHRWFRTPDRGGSARRLAAGRLGARTRRALSLPITPDRRDDPGLRGRSDGGAAGADRPYVHLEASRR